MKLNNNNNNTINSNIACDAHQNQDALLPEPSKNNIETNFQNSLIQNSLAVKKVWPSQTD